MRPLLLALALALALVLVLALGCDRSEARPVPVGEVAASASEETPLPPIWAFSDLGETCVWQRMGGGVHEIARFPVRWRG